MPQDFADDWFMQCLGATRQQVIIYTKVDSDLYRHMASLDHSDLE